MFESLQKALHALRITDEIKRLDIYELAEAEDARAGYGSPTILVNGKHLFESPVPSSSEPACRYYGSSLPGTDEIAKRIRKFLLADKSA